MPNESRTSKSIKNAQVSLIYYFIQLVLGFFSRKVFFDYLGSEVLGLNTTASNLLGFLNLAELGIGMSVGYFLYQPLYDKDTTRINKIIALQGWIYRRIAYVIIAAACFLMCFFPMIFEKSPLPLWYAYTTFGVLLFSAMLGYFVNYKQILLQADQKNYKVQRIMQGAIVIKTIVQIIVMQFIPWPFIFWLSMEILFAVLGAIVLNRVMKKEYPWLSTTEYDGRQLLREMPEIIQKTKQVFVHKASGVLLGQITPFLMYGFSSLTIVAYYGNYQLIVGKASYLLNMVFGSTTAGVGDLIASKNQERIQKVFWELFDSRLCISSIALVSIYFIIQPFIVLWLGEEYLLSEHFLILVLISSAIFINRTTVDSFISGYGLFKDVWAPIVETAINFGASLLFGYLIGFEGVLVGGILSQLIIICLWKPYFLYTQGMQISPLKFFLPVTGRLTIVIINFVLFVLIINVCNPSMSDNFFVWSVYSILISITAAILLFAQFYILTKGTRDFTKRIITMAKNK